MLALYLGAMAYLAAPAFGYHSFDANTIVSSFGAAPEAVKISAKAILALPFTFHASNGIRHLVINHIFIMSYSFLHTDRNNNCRFGMQANVLISRASITLATWC